MKRSTAYILLGVILIIIACTVSCNRGKKLLKNLKSSDVTAIEVMALPPNEIKHITKRKDIKTIVSNLRKVVVYNRLKKNNYNGRTYTYTLTMKNGTKKSFVISNPVVEIDGVFYKTKYGPAERLSNLYGKLKYKAVKQ